MACLPRAGLGGRLTKSHVVFGAEEEVGPWYVKESLLLAVREALPSALKRNRRTPSVRSCRRSSTGGSSVFQRPRVLPLHSARDSTVTTPTSCPGRGARSTARGPCPGEAVRPHAPLGSSTWCGTIHGAACARAAPPKSRTTRAGDRIRTSAVDGRGWVMKVGRGEHARCAGAACEGPAARVQGAFARRAGCRTS